MRINGIKEINQIRGIKKRTSLKFGKMNQMKKKYKKIKMKKVVFIVMMYEMKDSIEMIFLITGIQKINGTIDMNIMIHLKMERVLEVVEIELQDIYLKILLIKVGVIKILIHHPEVVVDVEEVIILVVVILDVKIFLENCRIINLMIEIMMEVLKVEKRIVSFLIKYLKLNKN